MQQSLNIVRAAQDMQVALREEPITGFDDFTLPAKMYSAQDALFKYLLDGGYMNEEQAMFSYVEPGCAEFEVIHIHLWSGLPTADGWLQVDVKTGEVVKL